MTPPVLVTIESRYRSLIEPLTTYIQAISRKSPNRRIVVVVPEKLQTIQEYRFLLYALMVIAVLLFRPEGLLPRPVRRYFPGWRP